MAELAPVERLQPFLLDRLTDDQSDTTMESRERRVMSPRDYRRAVLRDLQWLLNAAAHPKTDRLEEYPEVAKSVLNFGMPTLSGQTASGVTPVMVERLVRNAIAAYEPRVIQQTIQVTAVESEDNTAPYIIRLEIRGEAWNLPMPESLYIRTEVDLDTGQVKLSDPSSSG